ncbi:Uncharacterized protein FWK35_00004064 [Aphis craccivora]|uniref:Uncharacterized protein n=1 Tax=Aphis craccivora TaxID=307492 RepID=A0A6G0ZQ19_APHCR|nr:Uncharacterized protein FWK35_00004064 [Aphis craccivora]
MTLHARHQGQDQGLYQFSEFFIVKKCLKSSAQDLITDKRRESELKKLKKQQLTTIASRDAPYSLPFAVPVVYCSCYVMCVP